jgi:uncharacterized protein YjbJ (UPF0337 family)
VRPFLFRTTQKWAAAQPQLNQLAAEKQQAQQDLNALLAQMIVEQKNRVYAALDNTRGSLRDQVSGQANNLKGTINNFADNAINGVNGLIPDWVKNTPWLGDRVRSAQDAIRDAVNGARNGLNGFIDWTKDRVNDAIWQFVEMIKNAYITGGEINAKIDDAANWLKGKLDEYANSLNNKIGEFKGWILGGLGWTSNIGVGNWNVYDNAIVPFVNGIANNVQGSISGVSNFFKGFVDVAAPLAQKAVAVIVDSLFGDKTGNLYNQINGVDAKVAAIKNSVQNVINNQKAAFRNDIERLLGSLGLDGKKILDTLLTFGDSPSGQIVMVLAEVLLGLIPGVGQALDVKDTAIALHEIFVQGNRDVWAFIGLIGALAGWVPLVGDAIKGIAKIARKGIPPLVDLLRKIGPDATKAATKAIADTNWANLLKNLIADFKGKWDDFKRGLDGAADWVINALGLRPAYATANNGMLSLFSNAENSVDELTPVQKHFREVVEEAQIKASQRISANGFANSILLEDHFLRHGSLVGASTLDEYEQLAIKFLSNDKTGSVLEYTRKNGDLVRFDQATEEFGIVTSDGTIRTYYKPEPSAHSFPTNLDYYLNDKLKYE